VGIIGVDELSDTVKGVLPGPSLLQRLFRSVSRQRG